jgi:mRNA interferase MazF
MEIKQYQVVLINLNPTIGSEINKTRPCLVISPDELNKYLNSVIIAPLTTTSKNYPTRVPVSFENKDGYIVIDQIRTIDKSRIVKVFEKISTKEIENVKRIIKEALVD